MAESAATRRLWLLLLLLLVVACSAAALRHQARQEVVPRLAVQQPPEVALPTGQLASAFELARPATLRIEVRTGFFHQNLLGIGTGFFVSPDGLLLTAYHVVSPEIGNLPITRSDLRFEGVGPNEERYHLSLVGFDAYLDLALLRAETDGEIPYIPLATAPPRVGSDVVAVGNSRGDFLEARAGRVTRLGVKAARADFAEDTIELTASLMPGDSGGPVVNAKGEAVGVVSYISFMHDSFVPPFLRGLSGISEFASYAVPVLQGSEVVSALLAGGQRDVPVIGFSLGATQFNIPASYDPRDSWFAARGLHLGSRAGVIVGEVESHSPAERAGLRDLQRRSITNTQGEIVDVAVTADVIVAVEGEPTRDYYELLSVLRRKEVGDRVTLSVQRGDETVTLELTLGARRQVFR